METSIIGRNECHSRVQHSRWTPRSRRSSSLASSLALSVEVTLLLMRRPFTLYPRLTSARQRPGQPRWNAGSEHGPRWSKEMEPSPRLRRAAMPILYLSGSDCRGDSRVAVPDSPGPRDEYIRGRPPASRTFSSCASLRAAFIRDERTFGLISADGPQVEPIQVDRSGCLRSVSAVR